jgi:hypothetical protein
LSREENTLIVKEQVYVWKLLSYREAVSFNGLAHLPPDLASQPTLKTTFSTKWPPHPRAEGGQVEPVLGGFIW